MELSKFYNKIYLDIKDNSTIYEILELANSYYNYLTQIMIENDNKITQEKMDELIKELDEFLKSPYNNIINNVTILEENDIAMIIKDRYKLLNFNIEKEDFSTKNTNNLIKTLENIIIARNIEKVNLKIQNIKEIIELKQALRI